MDLRVTGGAILVSRRRLIMKIRSVRRPNLVRVAVTLEAELPHARTCQQFRVRRTVRRVTRRAAFNLQRRMLKYERSLLVCVTFQTPGISSCRKPRLLQFKTTMRVVTIAAFHHAFEHFVMKRPAELCFRFAVTTDAELRLTSAQHVRREHIAIASLCFRQECVRSGIGRAGGHRVCRVAINAANVVAPVLAAAEVVVFFLAGMATQAGLRSLFRRFRFERNDLLWIAFFSVPFTWSMTRLTTSHLPFPTRDAR